jgi:hypothetical protein
MFDSHIALFILTGLSDFGLPPLDPIAFEVGKITIDISAIHADGTVSNFNFVGLSKLRFVAMKAYFLDNDVRLEINVYIPQLAGTGYGDGGGTLLGGIGLRGKGKAIHSVHFL